MSIVLHGYWRSSASYRVRIALQLKGIAFEQATYDLRAGAHRDEAYRALTPHGLVPALEADGALLIESPAILEWIDARWPEPALLPHDPGQAAIVRAMAALIACDIHPLANLRVLKALKQDFGASQPQIDGWAARWIGEGLAAVEAMIARHGGAFAYGDTPTLADCYTVPQLFNAERIAMDLSGFPRLLACAETARAHPAFAAAHPTRQPDADH